MNYAWDFNGDGTVDLACNDLSTVTASYLQTGLYLATVTVTDNQGNKYTDTVIVNVLNRAEIDTLLKAQWEGMKTKLVQSDLDGALDYFTFSSREKYRTAFTTLQGTIGALASNMADIELVYVTEKTAKYRIRRNQLINGQSETITYYIYFSKNPNGIWRIEQF